MTDDATKPGAVTLPPPEGDEDPYSAATKVGKASEELLALVRAAEETATSQHAQAQASERPPSADEAKLAALMEAASRSAKEAAANEIARKSLAPSGAASKAPPASSSASAPERERERTKEAPKAAAASPAREIVRTFPEEASGRLLEVTSKRPARRTEDERRPTLGLPPAVAIVLVFAAATLALAALVR